MGGNAKEALSVLQTKEFHCDVECRDKFLNNNAGNQ